MTRTALTPLCFAALLGGCTTQDSPPSPPSGLAAIAAPGQDLNTVLLRPEDNCYWYEYSGPVETTLLPLRTADGRPICAA